MLVGYIRSLPGSVLSSVILWFGTEVAEADRDLWNIHDPSQITFSYVVLVIRHMTINIAIPSKVGFVTAFWIFVTNSQYFSSAWFLVHIQVSKIMRKIVVLINFYFPGFFF